MSERAQTTRFRFSRRLAHKSGAPKRWLEDYRHHLKSSFYVATVVASIVHILYKLELPLELPETMFMAAVAELYVPSPPKQKDARSHFALVEIDQKHHQEHYKGLSPLNRCQLTKDLKRLLANPELRVLAIDFDLSPVDVEGYQNAWKNLGTRVTADTDTAREAQCKSMESKETDLHRCQCELESVLTHPRNSGRIITITPLSPTQGRKSGERWDNTTDFPHVEFGSPDLVNRFGMVHDYLYPPPGYVGGDLPLAELIARRLCSEDKLPSSAHARCQAVPRPEQPAAAHADPRPPNKKFKKEAISFYEVRYLHKAGQPLAMDDACLKAPPLDGSMTKPAYCDIHFILLGGSYGLEDTHLTPLGHMTGAQTHAAIAAQMRAHKRHLEGYLGDIALGGLVFGPLVHWAWRQYFLQRAQVVRSRAPWRHPKVAYLWLLGLCAGLALALAVLVFCFTRVYAETGIWFSAVPMALGMLIEAMVSGSVHVANHLIRDAHRSLHGESAISEPAKLAAVVVGKLPRVAAVALILFAVYDLIHSH